MSRFRRALSLLVLLATLLVAAQGRPHLAAKSLAVWSASACHDEARNSSSPLAPKDCAHCVACGIDATFVAIEPDAHFARFAFRIVARVDRVGALSDVEISGAHRARAPPRIA